MESKPQIFSYTLRNGKRRNEDRCIIIDDFSVLKKQAAPLMPHYIYCGVFDGHCGTIAASYSAENLHEYLAASPHIVDDPVRAIREAFCHTDSQITAKCGTTATIALISGTRIYLAWTGDSEAFVSSLVPPLEEEEAASSSSRQRPLRRRITHLVNSHRPHRPDEKARVEQAGGFVMFNETCRVNGCLAVSRSLGDSSHKPFLSCEPDISHVIRDHTEEFLVLATDGLWDVLSPQQTLIFLLKHDQMETENLAKELVEEAMCRSSKDNVTAIVVKFPPKHTDPLCQLSKVTTDTVSSAHSNLPSVTESSTYSTDTYDTVDSARANITDDTKLECHLDRLTDEHKMVDTFASQCTTDEHKKELKDGLVNMNPIGVATVDTSGNGWCDDEICCQIECVCPTWSTDPELSGGTFTWLSIDQINEQNRQNKFVSPADEYFPFPAQLTAAQTAAQDTLCDAAYVDAEPTLSVHQHPEDSVISSSADQFLRKLANLEAESGDKDDEKTVSRCDSDTSSTTSATSSVDIACESVDDSSVSSEQDFESHWHFIANTTSDTSYHLSDNRSKEECQASMSGSHSNVGTDLAADDPVTFRCHTPLNPEASEFRPSSVSRTLLDPAAPEFVPSSSRSTCPRQPRGGMDDQPMLSSLKRCENGTDLLGDGLLPLHLSDCVNTPTHKTCGAGVDSSMVSHGDTLVELANPLVESRSFTKAHIDDSAELIVSDEEYGGDSSYRMVYVKKEESVLAGCADDVLADSVSSTVSQTADLCGDGVVNGVQVGDDRTLQEPIVADPFSPSSHSSVNNSHSQHDLAPKVESSDERPVVEQTEDASVDTSAHICEEFSAQLSGSTLSVQELTQAACCGVVDTGMDTELKQEFDQPEETSVTSSGCPPIADENNIDCEFASDHQPVASNDDLLALSVGISSTGASLQADIVCDNSTTVSAPHGHLIEDPSPAFTPSPQSRCDIQLSAATTPVDSAVHHTDDVDQFVLINDDISDDKVFTVSDSDHHAAADDDENTQDVAVSSTNAGRTIDLLCDVFVQTSLRTAVDEHVESRPVADSSNDFLTDCSKERSNGSSNDDRLLSNEMIDNTCQGYNSIVDSTTTITVDQETGLDPINIINGSNQDPEEALVIADNVVHDSETKEYEVQLSNQIDTYMSQNEQIKHQPQFTDTGNYDYGNYGADKDDVCNTQAHSPSLHHDGSTISAVCPSPANSSQIAVETTACESTHSELSHTQDNTFEQPCARAPDVQADLMESADPELLVQGLSIQNGSTAQDENLSQHSLVVKGIETPAVHPSRDVTSLAAGEEMVAQPDAHTAEVHAELAVSGTGVQTHASQQRRKSVSQTKPSVLRNTRATNSVGESGASKKPIGTLSAPKPLSKPSRVSTQSKRPSLTGQVGVSRAAAVTSHSTQSSATARVSLCAASKPKITSSTKHTLSAAASRETKKTLQVSRAKTNGEPSLTRDPNVSKVHTRAPTRTTGAVSSQHNGTTTAPASSRQAVSKTSASGVSKTATSRATAPPVAGPRKSGVGGVTHGDGVKTSKARAPLTQSTAASRAVSSSAAVGASVTRTILAATSSATASKPVAANLSIKRPSLGSQSTTAAASRGAADTRCSAANTQRKAGTTVAAAATSRPRVSAGTRSTQRLTSTSTTTTRQPKVQSVGH